MFTLYTLNDCQFYLGTFSLQCHALCIWIWIGNGKYRQVLCVWLSNRHVSLVPTLMLCNLYTYAPYLAKLCGLLLISCFFSRTFSRSVNCEGISTGANTTQVLEIWKTCRTHQGYVWHNEGIEMLLWNINLICPYLKVSLSTAPNLCGVGGVCTWWGVLVVEVCQLCV